MTEHSIAENRVTDNRTTSHRIKVKARLVVRRGNQLLVESRLDDDGRPFYRPIGGNVEFGETSRDAAAREFYEELQMHVDDLHYLGCLEEMYPSTDGGHHEVCFVYEGTVREQELYDGEAFTVVEDVRRYTATWKNVSDFQGDGAETLRPGNLLSLLSIDDACRKGD
ncbi:NUDIX domain-containing protein [Alicyclobacillus curvatus]|nr:NUDIX domain-containing protein [Alicyclobacillus curvatus]